MYLQEGTSLQGNGQQSIHLYIAQLARNEDILGIHLCGSHNLYNVCIMDGKVGIFFCPLEVLIYLGQLAKPIHSNIHQDKIRFL